MYAMITEDYVSYRVARLLKEKGFDETLNSFYVKGVRGKYYLDRLADACSKNSLLINGYTAPTHQMAMKWLREVHKILIVVGSKKGDEGEYRYSIKSIRNDTIIGISDRSYIHYEEAADAALEYCLVNLI